MNIETNTPKVSIIVPMYNVEMYIHDCVQSIINQSYKNIEIILINDGSPDNSGSIAEELALGDERIQVHHLLNGGVSVARNFGLRKASGAFIVFVDSDDYLSRDYIEYMLSIAEKTDAEFILSKNCYTFPGKNSQIKEDIIEVWDSEKTCTNLLFPGKIEIGCWNKMYKRSLLVRENILFPTKFYMGEGLSFIILTAQKSNVIGVGNRKVYHYRKDNLQSATTVVNVSKYINALDALDDIENNTKVKTKSFLLSLTIHKSLTMLGALNAMLVKDCINKYHSEYVFYIRYIRANIFKSISSEISIRQKIKLVIFSLSPKLLKFIYR